jgi:acid phosphatase
MVSTMVVFGERKLIFDEAAASAYNPILEGLNSKVSKYIDGAPLRVDGHPRASGILDTVRAAVANGVKVPAEFHEKTIIDTLVSTVYIRN